MAGPPLRSPLIQAPPCRKTITGNVPPPWGRRRSIGSGAPPSVCAYSRASQVVKVPARAAPAHRTRSALRKNRGSFLDLLELQGDRRRADRLPGHLGVRIDEVVERLGRLRLQQQVAAHGELHAVGVEVAEE